MNKVQVQESSNELKYFLRIISSLAAVLFPLFGYADLVYAPQLAEGFIFLRVCIAFFSLSIFAMTFFTHERSVLRLMFLSLSIACSITCHYIIFRMDDVYSNYYVGLILISLATSVFFLSPLFIYICSNLITYGPYILWTLYRVDSRDGFMRVSVHYLFILGFVAIFFVVRSFYHTLRVQEVIAREKLRDELLRREVTIAQQVQEISDAQIAKAIAASTQMLAHDVRKSFAIAGMGIDMLSRAKDQEEIGSILAKLKPQIDQSKTSIDAMFRDLSSARTIQTPMEKTKVDLKQIVVDAFDNIRFAYPAKNVTLTLDFRHESDFLCNRNRFERALLNLISNAFEATPQNFEMKIHTHDQMIDGKKVVHFEIANTNSFIPSEIMDKVFDPFVTKGKTGGTGLGLAICAQVVNDHGWMIRCESSESTGTKFIIDMS